jgi:hypothetical protein
MTLVRHKVFVSYHHDDQKEVDDFIQTYDEERKVFITRGIGIEMADDIIDSDNSDYVMKRIRELHLKDSTVTIVLIGKCAWARRYVDWEIQSSLRSGATVTPNGLLGIKLKSYKKKQGYPNRLNLNLKQTDDQEDCYARAIDYPTRKDTLANYIEDAFQARTKRVKWIENPRERFGYNRSCT